MSALRSSRRILRLAAILAAWSAPAAAQPKPTTWVWPGPAPCDSTLQACIDAAIDGDQVRIATNDPITEEIFFSKELAIRPASGFQPLFQNAVIQANTGRLGNSTLRLEGVTLQQSLVTWTQTGLGRATFVITGNTFLSGVIALAAHVENAGPVSFTIAGNSFTGLFNTGIFVGASLASEGRFEGVIADNRMETGIGNDPAIDLGRSVDADVLRNRIYGAAPGIRVTGDADVRIANNLLVGPEVPVGAPGPYGIGLLGQGAVRAAIVNNTIARWRSGIALYGDSSIPGSLEATVANNVLTHNVYGIDNDVNHDDPSSLVDYRNNLFFANYSDGWYTSALPSGRLRADPLYASDTDYHPTPGSPAIDAGDDASVPEGVTTDLDGNPRLQGDAVDIGAYEVQPLPVPQPAGAAGALAALAMLAAMRRLRSGAA